MKSQGVKPKGKEIGKLDNDVFKPFGSPSRPSSVGDVVETVTCMGVPSKPCGKPVTDDDEGVLCDACCVWFHASCQGVPEAEMKALKRYKCLAWLCSRCKDGFSRGGPNCSCCLRLESRIQFLEEALSEQAKMLLKVSDGQEQVAHMVKASHEKLESVVVEHASLAGQKGRETEKRQESYANIVKGSCIEVVKSISTKIGTIPREQKSLNHPAGAPSQQIAGIIDSVLDKEKRKKNIVVHNLPESNADTHADRMAEDKEKFSQLVKDEFHLRVSVSNSSRVGRALPGKHRLLIVTLDNEETKWDIIRLAPQLRNSELWPRVYLSPDLTKSEREEGKKLRDELKRRRDGGETNLTIRNRKIVEIGRRNLPSSDVFVSQHEQGPVMAQGTSSQARNPHSSQQSPLVEAPKAQHEEGSKVASVPESKTAPCDEGQEVGKPGSTVPDVNRDANSRNMEASACTKPHSA